MNVRACLCVLAMLQVGHAAPTDRAELLLGAIDVLLTAENMAAVGLDEARLLRVARDQTRRRYLRVRAVGGLGILGTAEGRRLTSTLAATDPDVEVRIQAVLSLARGFGRADPDGVARELRRLASEAPPAVGAMAQAELRRLEARPPASAVRAEP